MAARKGIAWVAAGRAKTASGPMAEKAGRADMPNSSIFASAPAINIEELQPAGIELRQEAQKEALHYFIAKLMMGVAEAAKASGVDAYYPGWRHGARIERPAIWRHEPAGTGDPAAVQSLENNRRHPRRRNLKSRHPIADQQELVRGVAFVEQVRSGRKPPVPRTACQEPDMLRFERGEKRMLL